MATLDLSFISVLLVSIKRPLSIYHYCFTGASCFKAGFRSLGGATKDIKCCKIQILYFWFLLEMAIFELGMSRRRSF